MHIQFSLGEGAEPNSGYSPVEITNLNRHALKRKWTTCSNVSANESSFDRRPNIMRMREEEARCKQNIKKIPVMNAQ